MMITKSIRFVINTREILIIDTFTILGRWWAFLIRFLPHFLRPKPCAKVRRTYEFCIHISCNIFHLQTLFVPMNLHLYTCIYVYKYHLYICICKDLDMLLHNNLNMIMCVSYDLNMYVFGS